MNKKTLGISLGTVALLSLSAVLLFPKGASLASADKVQTTSSNQVKKTAPTGKEKTAQKILKDFPTVEDFEKHYSAGFTKFKDADVFYPDAYSGEQAGGVMVSAIHGAPKDQVSKDSKGNTYLNARASEAMTFKEIKALYNK